MCTLQTFVLYTYIIYPHPTTYILTALRYSMVGLPILHPFCDIAVFVLLRVRSLLFVWV